MMAVHLVNEAVLDPPTVTRFEGDVQVKIVEQPLPKQLVRHYNHFIVQLHHSGEALPLRDVKFVKFVDTDEEAGILFQVAVNDNRGVVFLYVSLLVPAADGTPVSPLTTSEGKETKERLGGNGRFLETWTRDECCAKLTPTGDGLVLYVKVMGLPGVSDGTSGSGLVLAHAVGSEDKAGAVSEQFLVSENRVPDHTELRRTLMLDLLKSFLPSGPVSASLDKWNATALSDNNQSAADSCLKEILSSIVSSRREVKQKLNDGTTVIHSLAAFGYTQTLENVCVMLGEDAAKQCSAPDMNGMTPMHWAALMGEGKAVQVLLARGSPPSSNDERGLAPVDYARLNGHSSLISFLDQNGGAAVSSSARGGDSTTTSVHDDASDQDGDGLRLLKAALKNQKSQIVRLLGRGADIRSTDANGATALHITCLYGHLECAQLLIENGLEANCADNDGSTPLHKAAYAGETRCVDLLLNNGAEIDHADNKGATPLHIAAYKGQFEAAKVLVGKGRANVKACDADDVTPLHHACFQGHIGFTRMLIDKGADLNACDRGGSTPLHNACFKGNVDCARVLLDAGADVNTGDHATNPIHHCAFFGHVDCLKLLLEKDANPDVRDGEGSTALHKTAFTGNIECLTVLLSGQRPADVTVQDDEGSAPIHQAAFSGKADCLSRLIESGADVECQDNDDGTALHNACFNGHAQCVKVLLQNLASYNCADSSGASPLHFAVLNGHKGCATQLIEKGCDINCEDDQRTTPLHQSVEHPECVTYLIAHNADVAAVDSLGKTPLFYAVESRCDDTIGILVEAGADVDAVNSDGEVVREMCDGYLAHYLTSGSSGGSGGATNVNAAHVKKFNANQSPKKALKALIEDGVVEDTPESIARFMLEEKDIKKTSVGEILGEGDVYYLAILQAFIDLMDFGDKSFDTALRVFLSKFRLPGEAQKIDRFMERFAQSYCRANEDVFPHEDTAYLLAFSTIMLNTDLHNPQIKKKMTKEEFVKNNSGFPTGSMPDEYLHAIYHKIASNEIRMESANKLFVNPEKKGFMVKQGGRVKTWKKRYFVLSDNCLHYFKKEDDAQHMGKACGMIPLEDIKVRKSVKSKKSHSFELYHQSATNVKAMKVQGGKVGKGHHECYVISANTADEMEAWIASIMANVVKNPFQELIERKMREEQAGKSPAPGSRDSRKDKSGGVKNSKKAAAGDLSMEDLRDMAYLCSMAYKDAGAINEAYSQRAIIEPPVEGIRYFLVNDPSRRKQHLVLGGTNWDTPARLKDVKEAKDNVAQHLGLERIAGNISRKVLRHMKKDTPLRVCGHATGGCIAMLVAANLLQKNYKVEKVITFGQPKTQIDVEPLKRLPLTRVVCQQDPIPTLFGTDLQHVGSEYCLLQPPHYCIRTRSDKEAQQQVADLPLNETTVVTNLDNNHVLVYLRCLDRFAKDPAICVAFEERMQYV
eukprot:TRINITY_DN2327_c0_g1_i1.p1 TRINITY_DN2327_c0_g1~~TRINITY_DN2327_c0_g1_i1.p1  ORF type:complete len:1442 (+),score=522.24 TRINITY_DN2327_c0_g1_i1:236-4561(+)